MFLLLRFAFAFLLLCRFAFVFLLLCRNCRSILPPLGPLGLAFPSFPSTLILRLANQVDEALEGGAESSRRALNPGIWIGGVIVVAVLSWWLIS